ncbi:MAG: dihydroorotase [Myxococcota bacterium]
MTASAETTVLLGGRVVDPASNRDERADLVIERGRVLRCGPGAAEGVSGEHVRTIDASEHWVVPGLIDLHVHFREPGQEYKEDIESGLRAAAAGGFSAVCCMPNTTPVNDTRAITETMMARAADVSGARLHPFGAITRGLRGDELTEMADLKEAGAIGVSDDGLCVMNAAVMRHALEYAATFDLLVAQHCEDHHLTAGAQMHEGPTAAQLGLRGWPREAEDIIVARDILLAARTRTRYHVAHLSTAGAARLVGEAKARGLPVSAEVTPHHLLFTDQAVLGYDTHCKVNPPLREPEDVEALRQALRDGAIECIATDHAPHTPLEKDCEFDAAAVGINGLETAVAAMLGLVRDDVLTPLRLIDAMSTSPARLGGLDGGSLAVGAVADVTVLDPNHRWTVTRDQLASKSHNTPLLGQELQGRVGQTFVGGKLVYDRSDAEAP